MTGAHNGRSDPTTAHVPALTLERVLPDIMRAATARESLRGMTSRERKPYSGMFSARGQRTSVSDTSRTPPATKHTSDPPQSERIRTADTRTSVSRGNPSLDQHLRGLVSRSAHRSTQPLLPAEMTVLPPDDVSMCFAWGQSTRPQARQDGLLGTTEKFSHVAAKVSNVCQVHLRQLDHDLQKQTDACAQAISTSIVREDDPEAMIATKARLTGHPIAPETSPHKEAADGSSDVASMRPPSSSQRGGLEKVMFGHRQHSTRDPLVPVAHQQNLLDSATFLTELENADRPASRKQIEGANAPGKLSKADRKQLEHEVTARLVSSRDSVQPLLKNMSVVNAAIQSWLKGGCSKATVNHKNEGIVKNVFDSGGRLKNEKHFEKLQQILHVQKDAITKDVKPELALYLNHKDDDKPKKDFTGYNKEFVDVGMPHVRNALVLHQMVKNSKKRETAIKIRHHMAQQKLAQTHFEVEKKLPGTKVLKEKLTERDRIRALEMRQVVIGVTAIQALLKLREAMLRGRQIRFREKRAAKTIQRMIRYNRVLSGIRGSIPWARRVFRRFLRWYIKRSRGNQHPQSADIVKHFLYNMKEAARVLPAIFLFKRRVNLLQRNIRRFLAKISKTFDDNMAVYDRCESRVIKMILKQRDKAKAARSTNKAASTLFTRAPSQSKEAIDRLKEAVGEMGLSDHLKISLVKSFMRRQSRQYLADAREYAVDMRLYVAQFEKQDIFVQRMMEFTGSTDPAEIMRLTHRLSQGSITFFDKPQPALLKRLAGEEEMREMWYAAALKAMMAGEQDPLKNALLGLNASGMLDPEVVAKVHPLFTRKPTSPAATQGPRSASTDRHAQSDARQTAADPAKERVKAETSST